MRAPGEEEHVLTEVFCDHYETFETAFVTS
jgi:hypothetical protein